MRAINVSIALWICLSPWLYGEDITGAQILDAWEKTAIPEFVCSLDIRKVPDKADAVVPNAEISGRFCWKDGVGVRVKDESNMIETKGKQYVIHEINGDLPQVTVIPSAAQDVKSYLLVNCFCLWLKPADTDLGSIIRTRKDKSFEIQNDKVKGEHVVITHRNGRAERVWTLSKRYGWRPIASEIFNDEVLSRRNVFEYSLDEDHLRLTKLKFKGVTVAMDLGDSTPGSPAFLKKLSERVIGTSHITLRETSFRCDDSEFKVDLRLSRVIDTQTNAQYIVAGDGSTHNFTAEEYRQAGSYRKLLEQEGLLKVEHK